MLLSTMKSAAAFIASVALVATVVAIVATQQADTQELAKKSQALKYGSKVTLMTAYNEYLVVDRSGSVSMNGFTAGDNVLTIINPKGKKGVVKYGDKVSFMGPNGKYLMARYSGKVTARSTVIATDSTWKVVGGSGSVQLGDRVSFKDEFGYLTVDEDGASTAAREITVMQKYVISLPGQETGLREASGIKYGDVVTFKNTERQYLQVDHNGWGTIRGRPVANWAHFAVLSNEHREGHVSYGDRIVFRAHNGRFVSIRTDNEALEAVSRAITDNCQFQIFGSSMGASTGFVHSRDMCQIRSAFGFLESTPKGNTVRAVTSPTANHQSSVTLFQIGKVWDATL